MEWSKKYSYLSLKVSPANILLIEPDLTIHFANDAASAFFGLPVEKIVGMNAHDLIHPHHTSNHPAAKCPVFEPLKTGHSFNRRPDTFYDTSHQPVWIDYTCIPVIEEGRVTAMLLSWVPASVANRSQDSLSDSQATYKSAFESSIDSIFIIDNNGKIINANSAAYHFFDETSLIGKNFLRLFSLPYRLAANAFFEGMLRNKVHNSQLTVISPDGIELYVEATGKSDIQPDQHLVIFHNITNQIQAQRHRDEFAAIISHEVKNPLAVIKAFTQLLERRLRNSGDSQVMDYLYKIDDKVNFVAGLIANLTDTIRLGTGQLSFRDEPIDFDEFIKNTARELQRTYPSHKIRLTGKTSAKIIMDRHRLNQVVSNLINNAVKYSPDSKMVQLRLENRENFALLKVIDHGIGISNKSKPLLFQPFTRGLESAEKFPGLGLGLYLTKSILSHYNGKINFRSRPGKGSTFTIKLSASMP